MKAVVINGPGDVALTDVPDPTPGPGEVVLAVRAAGLCGTDLHVVGEAAVPGMIPGHELSGEVVHGVPGLPVGTLVAVNPLIPCGRCVRCTAGRTNLCRDRSAVGVNRHGGAAEFLALPAVACFDATGLTPERAAIVEPVACVLHGFDRLGPVAGDDVLVYGAGPMGLLAAAYARHSGAASVTVVEANEERRRGAGASSVGDLPDPPRAYGAVIDCTGSPAAIEDGLRRVARGGRYLLMGVAGTDRTASFSPFEVYDNEITIVGSRSLLWSFDRAVRLAAADPIGLDSLVSHRHSLGDYPGALAMMRAGTGLKHLISPWKETSR
ncbi:alcohol dehydrogenase catalytic domain-containing protein [Actinoplanes bogorensis]|uniref:Alcohol dehydrogenase catalytic domain-containing protein n=1 Tax=Paractinoplanes bogorensis TaxID=1610840 RepID=A0ABS5YZP2_9ACTN|nr:alcohol dehydrogenase catalytic domain-containing protein [Actinoplanes bogorensis]MBU2668897.1 alcohol dehydrogenase catalytic domain-containing protein [Actinoplanes bogorensis]